MAIASFFSGQMICQLAWLYQWYTRKTVNQQRYAKVYSIGNFCIGAWLLFWVRSYRYKLIYRLSSYEPYTNLPSTEQGEFQGLQYNRHDQFPFAHFVYVAIRNASSHVQSDSSRCREYHRNRYSGSTAQRCPRILFRWIAPSVAKCAQSDKYVAYHWNRGWSPFEPESSSRSFARL